MIFRKHSDKFQFLESYKERNLYYKFIGGYYFNELVEGYEERKRLFIQILRRQAASGQLYGSSSTAEDVLSDILERDWDITFDYHLAQIFSEYKKEDRGEMSDILLQAGDCFISFECKFLSDFTVEKDVLRVQERMGKFADEFHLKPLQVLLLKESKWKNARGERPKLEMISTGLRIPLITVFWEDFLSSFSNSEHRAAKYLSSQLARRKAVIV